MKTALSFVVAVIPGFAIADCTTESAFLRAAFESRNYTITRMDEVTNNQGSCEVDDIFLEQGAVTLRIAHAKWRLEGLEALTANEGQVSLNADVTDLVISPRTDDRWVTYMLTEQNRRNTIDITLSATWDFPDGTLEVAALDVDLPGDNRVVYAFRVTGATQPLLTGDPAALQAVSLEHMVLEIENRGFADALILGPLITSLSDVPGAPETVVEGTKRDLRALVSNLPGDVFGTDTKSALINLISAGPVPWGEVLVQIVPAPTIALAPFFEAALLPVTPDSISALFQGGQVKVSFIEDTSQN